MLKRVLEMSDRLRFSLFLLPLVLPLLFSCNGSGGKGGSGPPIARVSYLTAGFLPERQAVLVSWLPVQPLPPGFKGYIVYRTPPYSLGTALTAPGAWESLGIVTSTSLEDHRIQGDKSYGYAVAVTYLDTHQDPLSPWIWVDIPVEYVAVPPESPFYTDPCSDPAHTDSSFSLVPLDAQGNPFTRAVGGAGASTLPLKLQFTSYFFSPATLEIFYYRYSFLQDIPQTLTNFKFSVPTSCQTYSREVTLNNLDDPQFYLYRFSLTLDKNRFFYLSFPNRNATEWVYLELSAPPLGAILTPGYHTFQGRVFYKVQAVETRELTVFVKGGDSKGNEQYLAAFPQALVNPQDTLTVSGGFVIPEGITEVRFLALFAGGSPEAVQLFDEVHYHVVP